MSDSAVTVDRENRFDFSSMGDRKRTPQGGLIVDANLSRIGVLKYQMPDGTVRREYRPQDEVFHPESMASFAHAPITDDHPGRVDASNWKQHAVGHVAGTPGRKDRFLSGTLHIQDQKTIDKIESGELIELSCGYSCRIDPTSGVTQDGEEYDCVQRNVIGNHVALGPKGWGRAGPEVRLHMDGGVSEIDVPVSAQDHVYLRDMSDDVKAIAQAEAKAEVAEAALVKVREDSAKAAALAASEAEKVSAELKTAKAELEALKVQAKQDADAKNGAAALAAREAEIEAVIQVRADAKTHLDKDWKHDGKSVATIKREILTKLMPTYDLALVEDKADANGKTPALDAVYAAVVARADAVSASQAHTASVVAAASGRSDATAIEQEEDGEASKARKAMVDRKKDAFQPGPSRRDRARKRDGRGVKDNKPIVG